MCIMLLCWNRVFSLLIYLFIYFSMTAKKNIPILIFKIWTSFSNSISFSFNFFPDKSCLNKQQFQIAQMISFGGFCSYFSFSEIWCHGCKRSQNVVELGNIDLRISLFLNFDQTLFGNINFNQNCKISFKNAKIIDW